MTADRLPPARNRLLAVFDEQYSSQGNVVYATALALIRQTGGSAQYRVFCKGRYTGPRLGSKLGDVRVISRPATPIGQESTWRGRLGRLCARLHMTDAPARWLSNIDASEAGLLRLLFDVERTHALIIFASEMAFALKIARLAHIFAVSQVPHIVVVTRADVADRDILDDLRWLRARLLHDGSGTPATGSSRSIVNLLPDRRFPGSRRRGGGRNRVPIRFDEPRPLSFVDPEAYPYQMGAVGAMISWLDWIGPGPRLPDRVRDVVLFIRPDWMNCGTGTTFESLAKYFRKGDGLLIDIGIWPYATPFSARERAPMISEEQRHIRSALYFSLRRTTNLFRLASLLAHMVRFWPRTVSNQMLLQNALAAKPRLVRQVVRHTKLSHIYVNHYFTYLFAKDLIAGRKFFLDTHDIQAINAVHNDTRNVFTRRADKFHELLAEEMRIVAKAHRIYFVSEEELAIAAQHIPREKLEFIIPLPDVAPCIPKPLGRPARLLIIASLNRSNERSLAWFLDQVWPKVIGNTPLSGSLTTGGTAPQLDICGSINKAFADTRAPRVWFHGVVEDLRPFYQRSDLVLLPVLTGSGVAIKTIEALLHERPVLATQRALRGLPESVVETIGYTNDAQEFADTIRALIASPQLLHQRLAKTRHAAQWLRDQHFYERLSRAMDAVRLSDSPVKTNDRPMQEAITAPLLRTGPRRLFTKRQPVSDHV
jgi:glycosyltransferase involved in cell wall biosynthesis